jgi:hypothetical protein
MDADPVGLRGVEALYELARHGASARERVAAGPSREERGERFVGPLRIDVLQHPLDRAPVIGAAHASSLRLPLLATDLDQVDSRFARDPLGLGRVAVDELGGELDGQRRPRIRVRPDAPADPVARLEDADREARASHILGRRESRDSGADDRDVDALSAVP